MRNTRLISLVVPAALFLFFSSPLRADDGNYQNYIVGEQAAGMGGAVTALTTGVDACFYNPAGLADTVSNTISLSASLYGFYRYKVGDGWSPGEDIKVDSFVSIPSTFGSIWKVSEKIALALSAFIPDRNASNDLEAFVSNHHYFKYNKDDQTLWIGPSGGFRLSPNLSVGLSAFFVYRTFNWFRDWFYGATNYSMSEDIKYTDLSFLTVLGAKYTPGGNWLFGLRVQTPAMHITGDGEYLAKAGGSQGPAVSYVEDAETKNSLPTKITAGAAYRVPREYAIGLDISYNFPTSFNRVEGYDNWGEFRCYPLRREGTFDLNLGGEYYVMDRYPVRLGFFTSRSTAPKADVNSSWYPPHINKYGVTASVGRETEHTTLSFGVNYVWGSGEAVGIGETTLEVVDASESYFYVFLASSYLF